MTELTVSTACSGIESVGVACEGSDIRSLWFSEIEPFPCAVLAHRYPQVHNLGDMTRLPLYLALDEIEAPDIFVAGTPCQAFSVAGLREGLADARGNLTLVYVRIANEIDDKRARDGKPAGVHVWENVPGVLSSKDNAFGHLLAGLAGEDDPLIPSGKRWSNAGCVFGPQRTVAWRVLDAQYFGLAQRRKRVFIVASARAGFDPGAVLFEFDGVRRDTAPSREAGTDVAGTLTSRSGAGGFPGTDEALNGYVQPVRPNLICMAHGQGGAEVQTDDKCPTLTCNHEAPIAAYGIPGNWIGRKPENGGNATEPMPDVSPCLTVTDRHAVAYAASSEVSSTMTSGSNNPQAKHGKSGRFFDENLIVHGTQDPISHDIALPLGCNGGQENVLLSPHAARRLIPVECERLQGFPDDWTNVPYRGRPAADGPRYKAIGNSKAVPVVRWIMQRIKQEIEQGDLTL